MREKIAEMDMDRDIKFHRAYSFINGGLTVAWAIMYQISNIAASLGKNENAAVDSVVALAGLITFGLLTINSIEKVAALKAAKRKEEY
jgi:hypothetical protein